ncbi:MAG: hypothetical protein ACOZNI_15690 [Myxococcota bacterium]
MRHLLRRRDPEEAERRRWEAVWAQALPWRGVGDVERGRALADLMLLADAVIASREDGESVREAESPDDRAGRASWRAVVARFHAR